MKIQFSKSAKTSGSVLVITLCVAFVIGVTLASYLSLVENQTRSVARSQTWNDIMVVTEAGVEDGLELVNKYAGTPNLPGWTNTYAEDNWSRIAHNVYYVRRYLNAAGDTYYDVFITNFVNGPGIRAIGYVPASYAQGSQQSLLAAAGVTTSAMLSRQVDIQTKKDPLFNFALAALQTINMNGNNIKTDSFDSSDPSYSNPDGTYNQSLNKDGGDVVSNYTNSVVINVGNADIMGHVKTGPGGTISVGANGSVGSESWVEGGNTGVEDGWTSSDMNVDFPNVPSPDTIYPGATWTPSLPLNATVDGIIYNNAVTASGTHYYKVSSLDDKIYIGTNANVVIWVTGSSSFSGQDKITIASEGASLTIYTAGSFSVSGTAELNNLSQKAENFYLFGLPTCTSISLSGNGAFTGVVYAPQASLSMGGGGNNNYDFVGSALAKSVSMNGHFNFHYDEALRATGFGRGYIPSNWKESM